MAAFLLFKLRGNKRKVISVIKLRRFRTVTSGLVFLMRVVEKGKSVICAKLNVFIVRILNQNTRRITSGGTQIIINNDRFAIDVEQNNRVDLIIALHFRVINNYTNYL